MSTLTTPAAIQRFRLASVRAQLKLEKAGMKYSGGPIRPRIAAEFGLKPRAPHADYIAAIEKKMDALTAGEPA
jgi:hypothetical protein